VEQACAWALHQCAAGGGASRAGRVGSPCGSLVAGAFLSSREGAVAAASPVLGGGAAEGMAGSAATETKQARVPFECSVWDESSCSQAHFF